MIICVSSYYFYSEQKSFRVGDIQRGEEEIAEDADEKKLLTSFLRVLAAFLLFSALNAPESEPFTASLRSIQAQFLHSTQYK